MLSAAILATALAAPAALPTAFPTQDPLVPALGALRARRFPQAKQAIGQSLAAKSSPRARALDAWLRAELCDDADAAIALATRARTEAPHDPIVLEAFAIAQLAKSDDYGDYSPRRLAHRRPALAALKQAAKLSPSTIDLQDRIARYYLSAAKGSPNSRRIPRKIAQEIMKRDPVRANWILAGLERRRGDREAEEKALRKAVDLGEFLAEPRARLAFYLLRSGRTDEAVAQARRATGEQPGSPHGYVALGAALTSKADLDGALDAYRGGVARTGDHLDAVLPYASAAARSGKDLEPAITKVKAHLEVTGRSCRGAADLLASLGALQLKAGRKDEAKTALEAALKLVPEHQSARHQLRALSKG